ncbi:hypothetical protein CC85DRAFT_286603 [Cutaneotrichosporon oleaginosum]|uniref:Concanavalin A-like lectin/glucanase n=1 Tax=Cutaneotrichosporon oleaginosum TaxID=879819 RepID=A0A0J0XJQ5_9TREE|nr:uncharacterized protein CC85DRAFT_286603 [Cutaneotrichosporon oleaginosum]KLT41286.1 hypothetical protein CC85DRAFT_286603 [Cutaneotrichosporon oleaginosum]TXT14036.1 hypothetical protein COLE_00229 [Cutaneotrichosporon oleaginosum]
MLGLSRSTTLALVLLALGVVAQDTGTGSTDTGASGDTGNTGDTTTTTATDGSMGDGTGVSASPAASAVGSAPAASSAAGPAASVSGAGAMPSGTTGNGTVGSDTDIPGGNTKWNKTWFYMPDRRRDGYWVNGLANVAAWKPVPDPADIILVNSANAGFAQQVVYKDIPGGVQNVNVTINDIPVGSGYVIWLVEAGTTIKLGQSYGFSIKPAGTEQGSTATTPFAVPSFNPNPNGEANGAGGSAATNGAIVAAAGMIAPSLIGIGAGALFGFYAAMSAM